MNKGIPYLMAALVALTLSADWAAPVLALFEQVAQCLGSGGSLDLLHLRCTPPAGATDLLLQGWGLWLLLAAIAAVVVLATAKRPARTRANPPMPGLPR